MILGIDPSTFLEQQRIAKSKYYRNGKEINPFAELKKNGVSHMRIRIWNDPHGENGEDYLAGTCDLQNAIDLYKYLKEFDFKYIVDFHYSDFWADPAKQALPKAWANYTFDQVVEAIYEFTKASLIKIKESGMPVEFVQIGNEITHGLVYPLGKITDDIEDSFNRVSKLLASGLKALHEVMPGVKSILHLEESYNIPLYERYISNLLERNVRFDVIGSSYYPFWHHSFKEYFANMDNIQAKFNIPVMNMELGFPFTLLDYKANENGEKKHLVINADNMTDFKKMMPYECDPEGQRQFIETFLKLAKEHNLQGVCYWEPLWIPGEGICWASDEAQKYMHTEAKDTRNEWANQCLFDYSGNVLPAFDEYKI